MPFPTRPRARGRLLVVPFCAAALLVAAPSALADTKISIEDGPFANGAGPGKHVLIKDINSVFHNEPLDVTATRSGNQLIVSDAAGDEVAVGPECFEQGSTVRCPLAGVLGLRFEGSQLNDILTNSTNLLANMHGFQGDDIMTGGSIRDELAGGIDDDDMFGGPGNDVFTASDEVDDGADAVEGEAGTDTMHYGLSDDAVFVSLDGVGNDEEGDNIDVENLVGTSFGDTITGGTGANVLNGGAGGDDIDGAGGDDLLTGGLAGDDFEGGGGVDTVSYADQTTAVTVDIDGASDDGNANDSNDDNVGATVENVIGGSGPDSLTGTINTSSINGDVDNRLVGNGDDDALHGQFGDDVLEGGPGDDLVLGNDDDTLSGDAGKDTVIGADGNDVMSGGTENDSMQGSSGADTLDGGAGDDIVNGNTDDDVVRGGANNDQVRGEQGNDVVEGGSGDDDLDGFHGADLFDGGLGVDAVSFGVNGDVTVTLDNGLADDGGAVDEFNGKRDEVRLVEKVFTGQGNDLIIGDGDAETLSSGSGQDEVTGNGGADVLNGGPEDDELTGNDGDDELTGNDGNDELTGEAGGDDLTGGAGIDAFSGGLGNDELFARDGEQDQPISCGEDPDGLDVDFLEADLVDVFSPTVADCEEIDLP